MTNECDICGELGHKRDDCPDVDGKIRQLNYEFFKGADANRKTVGELVHTMQLRIQSLRDENRRWRPAVMRLPRFADTGDPIAPGMTVYRPDRVLGGASAVFVRDVVRDGIRWSLPPGRGDTTLDQTGSWYAIAANAAAAVAVPED